MLSGLHSGEFFSKHTKKESEIKLPCEFSLSIPLCWLKIRCEPLSTLEQSVFCWEISSAHFEEVLDSILALYFGPAAEFAVSTPSVDAAG
jgi:hypothetical protein